MLGHTSGRLLYPLADPPVGGKRSVHRMGSSQHYGRLENECFARYSKALNRVHEICRKQPASL